MMKGIVVQEFGDSFDGLRATDIALPERQPNEVLIQVMAVGVNFVDCLYVGLALARVRQLGSRFCS